MTIGFDLILWMGIFIISLAALVIASDVFTGAAEKVGIFLGFPSFLVGVTIVALGTSLPELVSSLFAVWMHSSEIVVGNVIGSNITNIFLILGCTAIIGKEIKLKYEIGHVDLPIMIGSALLLALMLWDAAFTLMEAILCLAGFTIYLLYTVFSSREDRLPRKRRVEKKDRQIQKLGWRTWIQLLLSGFFIYLGAKYTVGAIIRLSANLNIGKEVIAASAVALGTSLPELMVSISAARRGNAEMAIGNILGSNIFNGFAVMGIPALFGTLIIPQSIVIGALPILIIATALFYVVTQQKRVTRWEGWLLLIFYILFISRLFVPS